jgi:hypothetical protein
MLWQIELLGLLAESDIPGIRQQDKQAIRDVLADLEALRARCAELEGERDAAKAELAAEENNCPYPDFSCGTFAAERGIELRPASGPTYATTVDHWRGILRDLEAARAGEARAVEALRRIAEPPQCGCKPICRCRTLEARSIELECKTDIALGALDSAQPALAWLAQREREAAERQRVSDSNVVRTLGPHFCDFFFGAPGEEKALQDALAAACREAVAEWLRANNERLDHMNRADVESEAAALARPEAPDATPR